MEVVEMSVARAWPLALILVFGACQNPYNEEGTKPFECRDGVDNDHDGYIDCQDNGCWSSPDCAGKSPTQPGSPDTGSTGGTDTAIHDTGSTGGQDTGSAVDTSASGVDTGSTKDTGTGSGADTGGTAVAANLATVAITYTLQLDVSTSAEPIACDQWGICDCTSNYSGAGTQISASGTEVTFQGTWTLDTSDCADAVKGFVWVPTDGSSYHTLNFNADGSILNDWVAHGQIQDTQPVNDPANNEQWYITEMNATVPPGWTPVDHSETQQICIDPPYCTLPATLYHTVEFKFTTFNR